MKNYLGIILGVALMVGGHFVIRRARRMKQAPLGEAMSAPAPGVTTKAKAQARLALGVVFAVFGSAAWAGYRVCDAQPLFVSAACGMGAVMWSVVAGALLARLVGGQFWRDFSDGLRLVFQQSKYTPRYCLLLLLGTGALLLYWLLTLPPSHAAWEPVLLGVLIGGMCLPIAVFMFFLDRICNAA